jgi:hypothetical protein
MDRSAPAALIAIALDAFYLEHRRCGELESGVEQDRVWITCTCGALLVRLLGAAT